MDAPDPNAIVVQTDDTLATIGWGCLAITRRFSHPTLAADYAAAFRVPWSEDPERDRTYKIRAFIGDALTSNDEPGHPTIAAPLPLDGHTEEHP